MSTTNTTVTAIVMLGVAAVLAYALKLSGLPNDAGVTAAFEFGIKYLGFATSLAGFLGLAVGGGSLLIVSAKTQPPEKEVLSAMVTTATGLSVTLAGGGMVGGDPRVPAAALLAGGLLGAGYILKK